MRSVLISNMIGDIAEADFEEHPIPLHNVSRNVLEKVVEWCKHHQNDPITNQDDDSESRKKSTDIDDWDQKFMQVDQEMLFEIILVSFSLSFSLLMTFANVQHYRLQTTWTSNPSLTLAARLSRI